MNTKLLCGLFIVLLYSCIKPMSIDDIINKHDAANFDDLKNISIYFRSSGNQWNSAIYFIGILEKSCSPYAVEFNGIDKSIIEISNDLVISSCGKDYLTKYQIEKIMKKYIEYEFCLIQVDESGNLYINPYEQELPTLLRKIPNSEPADLYLFRHYRGNWYVRK